MIVWACIAPHGGEIIRELAGENLPRMARTRAALEELGNRCRAAAPETLVVLTPHGLCIDGCVTLSVTRLAYGELAGENGVLVSLGAEVDGDLAEEIASRAASRRIPVVRLAYDRTGKPAPILPMDWGTLVPLWHLLEPDTGARVVIVSPARSLPRRQLVQFGEALAEAAEATGRRTAVVCSADQGHGHSARGPYGLSPVSARFDARYCAAVSDNALHRLYRWSNAWIDASMTDSYWQTLMLHGALKGRRFAADLLSYEAPTYFGMACAEFRPE